MTTLLAYFQTTLAVVFSQLILLSAATAAPTKSITIGNVPQLVILANFSGKTTRYTKADFEGLFSTPGYSLNGAHGSVDDWFAEVSGGVFNPEFQVTNWITLPRASSYYKDPANWDDMGSDAIAVLDASGFNFSPFDGNNDGFIDLPPLIVHQGAGAEDVSSPDTIVSHYAPFPEVERDGVKISSYATIPEIFGAEITRIGVIIHEMGHVMGLPEMYDGAPIGTPITELSYGIGRWTSMAYWSASPESDYPGHYGAWERIQLGWAQPTLLLSSASNVEVDTDTIYRIPVNNSQTEYYLVENRQQVGFDRELPGSGLVIFHVDETRWDRVTFNGSTNNSDENRRHVDVVQADGLRNLNQFRFKTNPFAVNPDANLGDAGDPFPGTSNQQTLSTSTTPPLTAYTGTAPSFALDRIRSSGSTMFFDIIFTRNYAEWSGGVSWGSTAALDRESGKDPDGDGFANALEMSFGTNPLAADSPIKQEVATGVNSRTVSLSYPRSDLSDSILMEHSTDLKIWTSAGVGAETFLSHSGLYKQSHTSPASTEKRFYRLKVTIPPTRPASP